MLEIFALFFRYDLRIAQQSVKVYVQLKNIINFHAGKALLPGLLARFFAPVLPACGRTTSVVCQGLTFSY